MQTFGFAFVDGSGKLRITPAGHRLISGQRPQEIFLKQLLKWQYPSWQHGGSPYSKKDFPHSGEMDIFPFVETLRACRELGGLSKEEIGVFLLPLLNRVNTSKAISEIQDFRAAIRPFKGLHRKRRARQYFRDHFAHVYSAEIAGGNIGTRESQTQTVDAFLSKKVQNAIDVADAVIRYFRYTTLFTLSSDYHGLSISDLRARDIDRILSEMSFPLVDSYRDVGRYYEYFGNSDVPEFPWETRPELTARAIRLRIPRGEAKRLTIAQLKTAIEQRESGERQMRLEAYVADLQAPTGAGEITSMFGRILERDVVDAALFLEWNTWRAMASMDDCTLAHPNFTLDYDLIPFSTAPGNVADIEVEYNSSFVALVEVTMSVGARQYDTEGEPVTRHIGRFQAAEQRRPKTRQVYGIFVAPRISDATSDYFFVHLKLYPNPDFAGYLNIVPLSVSQFVDVFGFCKRLPGFSRHVFRDLLDSVVSSKVSTSTGREWLQNIPYVIDSWKERWQPRPS